jgi:hypothetical protein
MVALRYHELPGKVAVDVFGGLSTVADGVAFGFVVFLFFLFCFGIMLIAFILHASVLPLSAPKCNVVFKGFRFGGANQI